jgi:hypothetical protein
MNTRIEEYFIKIELLLIERPIFKEYKIIKKVVLYSEGLIRIRIVLLNDDILELFQFVEIVEDKLLSKKYSYHWQKKTGELIKRWDSAPHYKDLDNFPHHIHNKDNAVVSNPIIPNILMILDTIESEINFYDNTFISEKGQ